jgi:hypothetical protein
MRDAVAKRGGRSASIQARSRFFALLLASRPVRRVQRIMDTRELLMELEL